METFTDPRDGNKYRMVLLRDGKWWMAENLRYKMPGSFPADKKPSEMDLEKNPAYDWRKYGRLYTWEAAKTASPPGWHLPSDREWEYMLKAYGGFGRALGELGDQRDATGGIEALIRNELCIEFGGFLNTANSLDAVPPYAYTYYAEMLGKFWSTAKQRSFSVRGGVYYRFDMHMRACQDSENIEKAFSVRCIKGSI
jgi:uncharacterized protein (TIGR02145 family)